ncbi:MAG: Hpt domain-containing protein [Thermoleophilia bacterium]
MTRRLDEARLREQAATNHPGLYAGIARDWAAALPAAADRIRAADPAELPAALHELRSGAVAVGLPALAAALAALEQRAERGDAPAAEEVDAALDLAAGSAAELTAWWAGSGAAPAR